MIRGCQTSGEKEGLRSPRWKREISRPSLHLRHPGRFLPHKLRRASFRSLVRPALACCASNFQLPLASYALAPPGNIYRLFFSVLQSDRTLFFMHVFSPFILTTRFAGEHQDHGEKRVEPNPASVTSELSVVRKSLVSATPRCVLRGVHHLPERWGQRRCFSCRQSSR